MADVVHITEEEAARDYLGLFERVRAGEQVVVEAPGRRSVVMVSDEPAGESHLAAGSRSQTRGRTASEILDRLTQWESVHGVLVMDEGFADDIEVAHGRLNCSIDSSKWD